MEQLFELRRRTFDTPHFRGIEFIESEAKSIINRVPGNSLPFNWTLNPYRGCSHSCSYCTVGDTPILMADGRTKLMADIRVGDEVYGTEVRNGYRHYLKTRVLAHWSTVKPAFQTVLADGRELITSGDHRLLTPGGWAYVSPAGALQGRRRLVVGDRLFGLSRSMFERLPAPLPVGCAPPGAASGVSDVSAETLAGRDMRTHGDLEVMGMWPIGAELPMFDMTTGTSDFIGNGVVHHNCFARVTHTYMDMNAGRDFDSKIVVKVNAPELLRHELAAKRWKGESIAMGTATDPYQRAEGRYRLMPGIIRALIDYRNPFSVLTKGTLILRDLDLLREAAQTVEVSTALSVGTLDTEAWRKTEPGTPHPRKRIDAVRRLNEAGIPCGVMIAPVLPHITDDPRMLMEVVKAAVDAGATHVTPILLHLRPVVREEYMAWLQAEYPELVGTYEEMYVKAYAPKEARKALAGTIAGLLDAAGGVKPRPEVADRFTRWRGGPAKAPEPEEPRVRQPSLL